MRRLVLAVAVLVGLVGVAGCADEHEPPYAGPSLPDTGDGIRVAAAGDIACGNCDDDKTATLVESLDPDLVLALGDLQYETGALNAFRTDYDESWGRFKEITRPTPGNHEYRGSSGAPGYYGYWGAIAANPNRGWYSFAAGKWRVIALNSNCGAVGGCHRDSPQDRWLRAELTAHPADCTLAFWHQPRWSSGEHGSDRRMDALWQTLADSGADLVLAGHDHDYERFAPERGIRQFVVGTGGRSQRGFDGVERGSEVRHTGSFGVLELTLRADGYRWRFVPIGTDPFIDEGEQSCR